MYDGLIKALMCCGNTDTKKPDCEHCPMNGHMCVKRMLEGAVDAIKALTAENAARDAEIEREHSAYVETLGERDGFEAKSIILQTDLAHVTAEKAEAVAFIQHIDREYSRYITDPGFERWRGPKEGD